MTLKIFWLYRPNWANARSGRLKNRCCGVLIFWHQPFTVLIRSGELQTFPQTEEVGCIGLREQDGLIAALRSGVLLLDAQGKPEKKVAENPGDVAQSRFNDGRVDPWGNFWCGSLWEQQDKNGGLLSAICYLLCRVTPDLTLDVKARDIKISNGLAFSPDRRWMYHSDTPNEALYRYPLNEPGERTLFRRFDVKGGFTDVFKNASADFDGKNTVDQSCPGGPGRAWNCTE